MNTNDKHYACIRGFRTQEKAIKGQETHSPRVVRLLKIVLTIIGLMFLAQLSKVYFHSEVFSGVFNNMAVMAFLISPILIFGKRMSPEKEKEFLKNHPYDTEDFMEREDVVTDPTYSGCDFSGWYNRLADER